MSQEVMDASLTRLRVGVYFRYNSPAIGGLGSLNGCLFFAPSRAGRIHE